jgi:hypothetical protein
MPYIINKTNGSPLLTLEDGTLNDDYGVGLLGKNTIGYGEVQNENFIRLLENFASAAPPSGNILTGQVYYNSEYKQLNVYDGTQWKIIGDSIVHPKDPTLPVADQGLGIVNPSKGTTWFNSTTQQLFVYDTSWNLIGPEAVENFGATRAITTTVIDTVGTVHPIIKLTVNDVVLAVCSSTLFTIAASNAISGFSVLKPGITLSTTVDIKGNLDGNALTATRLQNPRSINGQSFDGSSDITITATASTTLSRGQYLTGDNFNGSQPTTWAVDATSDSNPLKVVVRDALGDFAARTITANLVGTVTGNVNSLTGTSQFNDVVANKFEGNVTGRLTGLASSASKLENPRTINGVFFDGTANISITAPTPNSLVPGQYVQGDSFNGSVGRSWNVLATPNNDSGKIVARDNQGNFVAGTITANITGNVTGNVTSTGISNFNILNATQISGSLTGNASGNAGTATRLQISRTINNINFDGTSDITIKSSTTNVLSRGSYLTGNNFDGSTPVTWAVDATSANGANKIVARDASGNFSANTVTASLVGNVTGNLNGNVTGNLNGTTTGTHLGNVVGNVSGNLTGIVSGASSENILRSGDSMTGRLGQSSAGFHAASIGNISTRTNSGFYDNPTPTIADGWPANSSWYHLLTSTHVNDANYYSMQFSGDFYSSNNIFYRATSGNGLTAWNKLWHSGNDGAGSGLDADTLDGLQPATSGANNIVSRDSNGNFSAATITASLNGFASGNVAKTGDSMNGYLTLVGAPVNSNHAATKAYVDSSAGYVFTYGATYSTSGFTNQVGSWNFNRNHFDIFPPAGKSMGNLVGFIPSIHVIHFAGGVNGDDSLVCTYGFFGDRIRVYVQNTEQRSTPAANWLAIWR